MERAMAEENNAQAVAAWVGLAFSVFCRPDQVGITLHARGHRSEWSWVDALRDAEILNHAEGEMLLAAESTGNLAWGLEELASRKTRRIESKLDAIDAVALPLATLLVGALVGLLSYAIFQYMVAFIEASL